MANLVHEKMSRWAIFHIIFALSIFGVTISMLLNDTLSYRGALEKELSTTMSSVGDDSWEVINSKAKARHKRNFYDNGLFDKLVNIFLSERDDYITRNVEESDDIQIKFVNNIQILSYQLFFRVTVLEYWLAILTPLCLAIIASGYFKWRKKKYQLGGASTGRGRLWMKAVWLLFVGFIVLLVAPPYIISLSVYTPVAFFLIASIAISNYISNFAKEF